MTIPTIIQSTDAGAPALTGEDGSLYNVLVWALPQLGWTLEFDDAVNSQAAFRNSAATGTGYYLKIIDKAADHASDAKKVAVRGYASMTDINTGLDPIDSGGALLYWGKSGSLDATARPWKIIGTETCFYFLVDRQGYGKHTCVFAGDIISLKPGDSENFLIFGSEHSSPATTTQWLAWAANNVDNETMWMPKLDGTSPSIEHFLGVNYIPAGTHSGVLLYPGIDGPYPEPVNNGIVTLHAFIKEEGIDAVRGKMPGLVIVGNNIRDNAGIAWASLDVHSFHEIVGQEMPHGIGTLSLMLVDNVWDWNYTVGTATSVLGWDLGFDWGAW